MKGRRSTDRVRELEAEVAQLTEQLIRSERALSVGVLSAGIAHHFNNLLSVILGYSSYVLNRERLSPDAADALKKIAEAAQRGRRLTEEMMSFLGGESEEIAPCRVHDALDQVLSLLESKIGASIRVSKRWQARHDTVLALPSVIRQIVFNLVTHALDSLAGAGELEIQTANVRDEVGADREYLRIEVSERRPAPGPRRAEPVSQRLKLTRADGMVAQLEGSLIVAEDSERGSRIQVLLPVAAAPEAEPESGAPRRRLTPRRIWVVDDDPIFREMCRQVLSDGGDQVEEIESGTKLKERWRAARERPDVIVMDFSMPEANGLQLCEWLKSEGSSVPVVLVSGFAASQPDIQKALRIKKTFFLQKPFSFRELNDVIAVATGETFIGEEKRKTEA